MNNDLKKLRRGGFYWVDNKPFVSVTNILKVIDKPALRYWYGQQVYRAMVIEPSLSEQEALAAPYKINAIAKNRGTTVHSIVEVYKVGNVEFDVWIETVLEDYRGYARAFNRWVHDLNVKIVDQERTVFSKVHQYAGTVDLLAEINGDQLIVEENLPTVIDVKTGKDIYVEASIQASAYRNAIEEGGTKTKGIGVLLLMEDGTYKYQSGGDKFDTFLACKKLWEGLNTEMLEKVGYLI